jgi:hypothetical protein
VTEGTEFTPEFYYWNGEWTEIIGCTYRWYLTQAGDDARYPYLLTIKEIKESESIEILVRHCIDQSKNDDEFIDISMTLNRGNHYVILKVEDIYLDQDVNPAFKINPRRFAVSGDVESVGIGDYDLTESMANTVMSDNFQILFDDEGDAALFYLATNKAPSLRFYSLNGTYLALESVDVSDLDDIEVYIGAISFDKIANLFTEAEDATLVGGAATTFQDDFSTDTSGLYEENTGDFTWNTGAGRLECSTANKQIRIKTKDWENGTYEFKWTPQSVGCQCNLIFCSARDEDAGNEGYPNNGYYVRMDESAGVNNGAVYVGQVISGTVTDARSNSPPGGFSVGTQYTIEVTLASGPAIEVRVNGTLRLSWSSAPTPVYTDGAFGIGNITGTNHFDDVDIDLDVEEDASNNEIVYLKEQYDTIRYVITGITDLPTGRYMAIFRLKDTEQIASDIGMSIYNSTDSTYLNEENATATKTVTSSYGYYKLIFDMESDDDGDTIWIAVRKETTTPNIIMADYILIVPIGNGESLPQDLAHNALRTLDLTSKIAER